MKKAKKKEKLQRKLLTFIRRISTTEDTTTTELTVERELQFQPDAEAATSRTPRQPVRTIRFSATVCSVTL